MILNYVRIPVKQNFFRLYGLTIFATLMDSMQKLLSPYWLSTYYAILGLVTVTESGGATL